MNRTWPLCRLFLVLGLLGLSGLAAAEDYPPFNVRVGTQTFGPKYSFTDQTRLVETAQRIYAMGSDVIKFPMSSHVSTDYGWPPLGSVNSLRDLAQYEPSYRQVFDMPFKYYLVWAYPFGTADHPFLDGLSIFEQGFIYDEMYDFTRYLLRTYNGSGKTFLLGNWEGDWPLLGHDTNGTPSPAAIDGMVKWLNTRQEAIEDAKRDEPHENVFVWHYAEVNLVRQAMNGGQTVTNSVLPKATVDLVSYSAYDTINDPSPALLSALDYIASQAHTTGHFAHPVFIGEYGFPLDHGARTPEQQAAGTRSLIRTAAGWGCPFVLYWQMYDNEADEGGANARGFWLVDNQNQAQPAYFAHQQFLGKAHAVKNLYRLWLDRNPAEAEFSNFCGHYEEQTVSGLMDQLLRSDEYATRLSNGDFVLLLMHKLLSAGSPSDPDYVDYVARLSAGESRVAILTDLLDSARFRGAWGDEPFADYLFRGTLCRAAVDHGGDEFQALLARLNGGEERSSLWREFLNREEFSTAELGMRDLNTRGATAVARKYFFELPLPAPEGDIRTK